MENTVRDVLDEILDLTESVSAGFPTYSFKIGSHAFYDVMLLRIHFG